MGFGSNLGKGLGIGTVILALASPILVAEIANAYKEGQKAKAEIAKYEYLTHVATNLPHSRQVDSPLTQVEAGALK